MDSQSFFNAVYQFHEIHIQYQYERGPIDDNAYNLSRLFTRMAHAHVSKCFRSAVAASPPLTSVRNFNIIRFRKTFLDLRNGNLSHAKPARSAGPNSKPRVGEINAGFCKNENAINSCFLSLALLYAALIA